MRPAVRPAAVAGAFYPEDSGRLETDVRAYLTTAEPVDVDFQLRILVVPHAGYVYSGPVAATGYRLLEDMPDLRRIVMLGPSHYVWFSGLTLPGVDYLETPLGDVPIDRPGAIAALESPLVVDSPDAHQREHSLEVQLPFLQIVAPGVPVVPMLTGDVDPVDVADVVDPLLDAESLLLVSSDLSHYHDYEMARRLDAETVQAIERFEPNALERESACGLTGIQAALHIAKRRGYRMRTLDLRNSGDTAGPHDRVVGYGTFAFGD
ncbi:MAG: AmmeMemoRadiSam system protein B [Acidimicrobiia bacterium]